ncbi:MAG: hypothetical protein ICV55_04545 [Coleofasciculus sp. C3-bin4]|jgi:hypothetical protein|nr:hypothetical protein [Coleofasciculus sp. C3-bin4]
MIRQTLVVLGIGAVVAGVAPIADAQSAMPSSSDNSSVTLSGRSLRAIESRTLADDYQNFFNGTSQVGQTNSVTNIGRLTQSQKNSPLSNVLSDQVDVVVGDTLTPDAPLTSFPSSGDEGDRNRVRLQLQLGE